LQAIYAVDPYSGRTQLLKGEGEALVRVPELLVAFSAVAGVGSRDSSRKIDC
jgi:hypothetical protein